MFATFCSCVYTALLLVLATITAALACDNILKCLKIFNLYTLFKGAWTMCRHSPQGLKHADHLVARLPAEQHSHSSLQQNQSSLQPGIQRPVQQVASAIDLPALVMRLSRDATQENRRQHDKFQEALSKQLSDFQQDMDKACREMQTNLRSIESRAGRLEGFTTFCAGGMETFVGKHMPTNNTTRHREICKGDLKVRSRYCRKIMIKKAGRSLHRDGKVSACST